MTPKFLDIPAGEKLVRVFNPTRHDASALTFRTFGPKKRFDHHRGTSEGVPCDDPERAVYYGSWSPGGGQAFSSCLVEVFGDTHVVELSDNHVALPTLVRALHLLDLRGNGAMNAGTNASISKCEHRLSQPWSRHFYEDVVYEDVVNFDTIDGISYLNAHNDEPAVALYERAQDALTCRSSDVIRLDDAALRPLLLDAMRHNNLFF